MTRPAGARAVAHEILVRVETSDAFADVLLAHRLAGARLGSRDQALATHLVYGTLAWQGRLDFQLAALVRRPLSGLDPDVRAALRIGLFQLLFLDRVPAHAAVDGSVRLVRSAGRHAAAGLVNAVLRRAAAAGPEGLALPGPGTDPVERLAVEWSHPRWLVERWMREGGEDIARRLAANNVAGDITIRANPRRTSRADLATELAAGGVRTTPGRFAPHALVVTEGAARVRDLPAWREGRVAFQGEASQLVAMLVAASGAERILDACAAPGGKALALAAAVGDDGRIIALDRNAGGLRVLASEAARLGFSCLHAVVADATASPIRGACDAVLVDAPCSGLGTLRRHPELRWRRRPQDITRLAGVQAAILDAIAPQVRPGGVLVFAVCTLTPEENEDRVRAFLATHPAFAVEPAGGHLPASAEMLVGADGFLRTLPHRDGLDGFFAARLRRRRDLDSGQDVG